MISGIITGALLVLFIGAWIWAWSPKRKQAFDEAARLPLSDGDAARHGGTADKGNVA